jgi:hypothetical protein
VPIGNAQALDPRRRHSDADEVDVDDVVGHDVRACTAFFSSRRCPASGRTDERNRWREKRLVRAVGFVQLMQEVFGKELGIAVAFAQRRHFDRKHREPIHQILAQLSPRAPPLRSAVWLQRSRATRVRNSCSPPTRV